MKRNMLLSALSKILLRAEAVFDNQECSKKFNKILNCNCTTHKPYKNKTICAIEGCNCEGEGRFYFFEGKVLCDQHYAEYMECLLDNIDAAIDEKIADIAFEKYKMELTPYSAPSQMLINNNEGEELERYLCSKRIPFLP